MDSKHPTIKKELLIFAALFLTFALGALLVVKPALADVAPPRSAPGANPEIDTVDTNVRMLDEKVMIEVQEEVDIKRMGTARVLAEFHMENQGSDPENLLVRFPVSYSDGFAGYSEIIDLKVHVDDIPVTYSPINLEGEPDNWDDPIKWVEFEVSFPPGEVIEIGVNYTLYGTGEYPFVSYAYLLETGAGWYGTIGSAEITVSLPYEANNLTVFVDSSPGWGGTTPGGDLSGNEISWNFEDLEPGYEDNISVALVWPSAWNAVERERKRVTDFPADGEAWGRLAKLYKEISRLRKGTRTDPGGEMLFDLSDKAYQKAIELLPRDGLWHLGYADLLLWDAVWDYRYSEASRDQMVKALQLLYTAYQLEPDQPLIREYLDDYYFPKEAVAKEGEEYVYYWLTETPTVVPFPESAQQPTTQPNLDTATPEPTSDQPAQAPSTGENEEQQEKDPVSGNGGRIKIPFCSSAVFFPLALAIIAASTRHHPHKPL